MDNQPKNSKNSFARWYNLDNAANIFPAISDERNTNVFRLSCELRENIDKQCLQEALDRAMRSFSYFRVIMRRGLFWYYLEQSDIRPVVEFESQRPCARLFYRSVKELLFKVTYYRKSINLEVFHSVSDGSGAFLLLRAIVYNYILLRHKKELPAVLPPLDNEGTPSQKSEDSFQHHYDPTDKKSPFSSRAYSITGTLMPSNIIKVLNGRVSTQALLTLAKSHAATATAYLTALLICAVYTEQVPRSSGHKPVGVTIPVNLRGHFASQSARNFFGVIEISYNFAGAAADFDKVLASVKTQLEEKLRKENLSRRMNYTTGVQKNVFARIAPLALKNLVLKAAYNKGEAATTCAFSNVGRITMPAFTHQYIGRFSCMLNPTPFHRIKLSACSFEDEFVLSFSSCIEETKVQKYFFRHLAAAGLEVCINSNGVDVE